MNRLNDDNIRLVKVEREANAKGALDEEYIERLERSVYKLTASSEKYEVLNEQLTNEKTALLKSAEEASIEMNCLLGRDDKARAESVSRINLLTSELSICRSKVESAHRVIRELKGEIGETRQVAREAELEKRGMGKICGVRGLRTAMKGMMQRRLSTAFTTWHIATVRLHDHLVAYRQLNEMQKMLQEYEALITKERQIHTGVVVDMNKDFAERTMNVDKAMARLWRSRNSCFQLILPGRKKAFNAWKLSFLSSQSTAAACEESRSKKALAMRILARVLAAMAIRRVRRR